MKRQFDITIVGAGVAGLTTAALLSRSPQAAALRIRLVDAGPRPQYVPDSDYQLRVSAIANGSADLLQSVGAWPAVAAARVSPYESMRVWDERGAADDDSALLFDAAEFAVPQLGFIVENALLQVALLQQLEDTDVAVSFDTRIERLPDADLVIGADGARSVVRTLAQIGTQQWPYEQTAFVTHLQPSKDHGACAQQRFLRDGPLGMLPLADGRISVVWSTLPAQAEALLAADDADLSETMTAASDGVLGELTVAGPRGAFPLCAQHADTYAKRGVVLIGDAAHAIHPLAGQGANLGLQDAAKLVAVIEAAVEQRLHPGDLPVLRRYERARKGANLTMLHFMTGLNRLFTTDSSLVAGIRSTGMRLFNRSGPIRERAVKVALGVQ